MVHFKGNELELNPCLPLLPTPILKELTINHIDIVELLEAIPRICQHIERLKINISDTFLKVLPPSSLQSLVCALPCLTHLQFPSALLVITPAMIQHLGDLPGLQECGTVQITGATFPSELNKLFAPTSERFSNLRRLMFHSPTCGLAENMIKSLHRSLEHLGMYIENAQDPLALASLIASLRGHTSLVSFKFLGPPTVEEEGEGAKIFTPLFELKELEEISINNGYVSQLDDEDLAAAAAAWPCLRDLNLTPHVANPTLTLAGLVPLVKHCPLLTRLTLPVQCTPFDATLLDLDLCESSRVAFLILSCSTTTEVEADDASWCLAQLFPNLKAFMCPKNQDDPSATSWNIMADRVNVYLGRCVSR
ncbi:hypothetical protein H0H81_010530 [Sphagnurus paluster]|uniref:Uncharacterized protein n=1 Tax=Sphagnurus paluster TaxID=117069 RepID=A0A9P7FSV8_9AGAR|nr:hypothetical protein H0H81_010530 [Sphagnurus paluster]